MCDVTITPSWDLASPTGNPKEITPFLASQQVPASDSHGHVRAPPISSRAIDSNTIYNDPPPMIQYFSLLALPNQTFQEAIYLGTTLAETRLTAEF
jgi:hypothetical protein